MSNFNHQDLKVNLKISIEIPDSDLPGTFGKGTVSLLQGIVRHGSLNRAAKEMHMAYSKAWRLVKEAEGHVGVELLDRRGPHGSDLTPEGKKLLAVYDQMERELKAYAQQRFVELMNQDQNLSELPF